jgi:hypothetical protein
LLDNYNFENLYKDFQKISTIKMRMLASACAYKLKTEKKLGFSFQQKDITREERLNMEKC